MKDKTEEVADDGWQLKDGIRQTKQLVKILVNFTLLLKVDTSWNNFFFKSLSVPTKPELINENFIKHLHIYDGRWAINSNKSDNLMRFYIRPSESQTCFDLRRNGRFMHELKKNILST